MQLKLAIISTREGTQTFHSLTLADLESQVAAYCRDNWENMDGEEMPDNDADLVAFYFDGGNHDLHEEAIDYETIELETNLATLSTRETATESVMPTFTFWCQQSDGTGTIYIGSLEAPDIEAAKLAAVQECCDEWNSGSGEDDEPTYTPDNIHLLGIAAGDVEILHWQDICEA